ncbi:hypothetical protein [Psychroflexus sp. ALD_RP9]|uniref:hypothetical protein n=1 Tax=Psychroflexus sp. ALD_RP9 TaxID=2777186 RepID=UPI001A8CD910|nr:hypothetical protein [Psychroflexus sp. ALD_RP9]QSS96827.1 hypothetical protein IMZ30_10300 [Psychroflexus sp. ALD_RP9]
MSFGAGHTQDMINRIKQNKAQLLSKRKKFRENNREGIYINDKKTKGLNSKPISKKKLIEIKKEIRKTAKKNYKREIIIYIILFASILVLLLSLLLWLNESPTVLYD